MVSHSSKQTICLNCKKVCNFNNGYFGFYENGWLTIEINSIIDGHIGTYKGNICSDCKTVNLNQILENVKKTI